MGDQSDQPPLSLPQYSTGGEGVREEGREGREGSCSLTPLFHHTAADRNSLDSILLSQLREGEAKEMFEEGERLEEPPCIFIIF